LAAHSYQVVPASIDHIESMLPHIREADIVELWAANRVTPEDALLIGIGISTEAWTGLIDGKPVCIFGVAPASMLGGIGVPWMVGTADIDKHAKAFLRRCKSYVKQMLRLYNYLVNYVDSRNTRAIAWLRWLGFTIYDAAPYGFDQAPFHRFEMRT
jgi:hypothetical protein